ncbi:MAG: hypothetical protein NXI20_25055 [bacterium]|nr:hypothetical protein [bacterium]
MRTKRIVIYPKDIQRITGKSERYGRLLLERIRKHSGKSDHQFVTFRDFSSFTGIDLKEIEEFM